MRLLIAHARQINKQARIAAGTALVLLAATSAVLAQTPPETLRIQVKPADPGIRSISIDGRYRPIISRDDSGVVIDTLGSSDKPPACSVQLEVTLENSRVLNRSAEICSGGTLIVDVDSDGKPGTARVVGEGTGAVSAPATTSQPPAVTSVPDRQDTAAPAAQTQSPTETPAASQAVTEPTEPRQNATPQETAKPETQQTPDSQNGILKPLETVETPIDEQRTTPKSEEDFSKMVGDSLNRHKDGNGPAATSPTGGRSVTVAPSEDRAWQTEPGNQSGAPTYLTHGVPQTDDIDFRAACRTQSGQATIVFAQTSASTAEGVTEPVSISAGSFSMTYSATGSSANNQYGQSFPQITLPMTDPLWQTLIQESTISVKIQGTPAYTVSLKGSAKPVRLFVATCSEAQTIVEDGSSGFGDPNGFGGSGPGDQFPVHFVADFSCADAGRVRSQEGERGGQIVFKNNSARSVDINWIGYNGEVRHFATLQPGQLLNQQTFVTHAWLVQETGGRCLGIVVSRTPYREVDISGGRPTTQAPPPRFNAPNYPENNTFGAPPAGSPFGGLDGRLPPANIGGGPQTLNAPISPANSTQFADYLCTGGVDLHVSFSPDRSVATVAEIGRQPLSLPRLGGASQFAYGSNGFSLQGSLQNATWSRPGQRDVFCAKR